MGQNDDTTNQVTTIICPAGSYCPVGSSTPISCPAGYYCDRPRLSTYSGACYAGYICSGGSTSPQPLSGICPAGYYCEAGVTEATACPTGTYLPSTGGTKKADCLTCPPGKYCSSSAATTYTGDCAAGYYCPAGSTSASPPSTFCEAGYRCVGGYADEEPCPVGQYQLETGQSSCTVCPAGYYCQGGSQKNLCPSGSYCPGSNVLVNCPPGTYKTDEGGSAVASCLACPAGQACEKPGMSYATVTCAPGYYCVGSTATRFPTDGTTGNKCASGTYCPERSSSVTTCTAGSYCAIERLAAVSGACQEGYYCIAGSTTGKQYMCSAGKYCPAGSSGETACPKGTYGPLQGASSVDDCINCNMGAYCDTTGMSAPSATPCAAGYYCPLGSTAASSQSTICPKGYMCPANSVAPTPCPAGTYQPLAQQTTCITCGAGYYCDGTDGTQETECPRGYYCPSPTVVASQYPCPAGSYNEELTATASTFCSACQPGYYCPLKGQSTYSDVCAEGYVCTGSATVPNPASTTGNPCPSGYYCASGSSTATECAAGTFYDGTKAIQSSDCQQIPPGKFSTLTHATTALLNAATAAQYGNCNAGYVCLGGSFSATPATSAEGKPCPKGSFCPAGSAYDQYCLIGTYSDQTGLATCKSCPTGKYCPDIQTITPTSCIAKYYCPAGSGIPLPCPPGTYSSTIELTASTECSPCPGGMYCEKPATDSVTTQCAAGYVCASGSADYMPSGATYDGSTTLNGFCPVGYYCPLGTSAPKSCAAGTYQDAAGNSACKSCKRGYGCPSTGMGVLTTSYQCDMGYLCAGGSTSTSPSSNLCPAGYYCPQGTPVAVRCADGTYQQSLGQGTCNACPAGKGCYYRKGDLDSATSYYGITVIDCPGYYYCPGGNSYVGKLCDKGKTSTSAATGLKSASECNSCAAGKYCVDSEKGGAADSCAAGYYCESGSTSPTPSSEAYAKPCSAGFYCTYGATDEVQCPAGKFRGTTGARSEDECTVCLPGQYCTKGNPVPYTCPKGSYCPLGTSSPLSCPVGTYNDVTGASQKYECASCPAGYYCDTTGLAAYTDMVCPASYYCLVRTVTPIACLAGFYIVGYGKSAADCIACSANYYCPSGSSAEIKCGDGYECPGLCPAPAKCDGGYYCVWDSTTNTIVKTICPSGYYCPIGSSSPTVCTTGYVCPEGSIRPAKCPYGSFIRSDLNASNVSSLDDACMYCERGYYASDDGCSPCPAGYICLGHTITKYPVNVTTDYGYECPEGYYCPEMSYIETACPIGTYRNEKKGKSIADCISCPVNTFNDKTGQATCRKCGPSATSEVGNTTCTCIGSYREFFKSDTSCRCISGYYQTKYGITSKTDDSSLDCEPHLYSTCSSGTYNQIGECSSDCSKQCNGGSGTYSSTYGVCICSDLQSLNDTCNSTCRSSAVKTKVTSSNITIYNPNNATETLTLTFSKYSRPSPRFVERTTTTSPKTTTSPTFLSAALSPWTTRAAASPAPTALSLR